MPETEAETDLAFAGIAELAPRIAAGEVSPVALTEAALARIEARDGALNAFMTVTAERALAAARDAEAEIAEGRIRGPLHGVPLAVKDLFATKGVRTTGGSKLLADWVPDHDAAVIERLKAAGAVLLGKTGMHELAYGTTSNNAHYGPVRNPWDPACHPGGSSGGSAAAVAAGLAYGALGSDTGASIRQPAACCGIVGLKPTFGRISKFGALPLSWSLDHMGPMARSVADAALMLQALAGPDPRDPNCVDRPVPDYSTGLETGVAGKRIALARGFFFADCDPEVAAAVEAAARTLEGLGARIEEIELPELDSAYLTGGITIACEATAYHAKNLRERPEAFSEELRGSLELGAFYSAVDYLQAQRVRRRVTEAIRGAMAPFDAVLSPTSPVPATPIGDSPPGHSGLRHRNTIPFNLTGLPAISLPCGLTEAGLPIGLQIAGPAFDEAGILAIARAFESAGDWQGRRPPAFA
ncbi:MAG: Asp-tRNA(Asn)/Glu-tRNA(Gln) amidotransferase subunit GatA [Proteobacteria bacterium]|nr:Asp-tRNA(Asn)/Glu-tRNA(Gln) amidotransferase subunit GatA [Pseudomonadota bacterium]